MQGIPTVHCKATSILSYVSLVPFVCIAATISKIVPYFTPFEWLHMYIAFEISFFLCFYEIRAKDSIVDTFTFLHCINVTVVCEKCRIENLQRRFLWGGRHSPYPQP